MSPLTTAASDRAGVFKTKCRNAEGSIPMACAKTIPSAKEALFNQSSKLVANLALAAIPALPT